MLPTLRQRYEQKKPIVEALDTRELKKMGELLSGLGALIKPYDLPELQSGLQKANDDLAKSIGGKWNRIKAGGNEVKANPAKLAKVASFQTAFVKGLKQLPHILEIIRGLESSPTDEGEIIEAEAESSAEKKKVDLPSFPERKPPPFKGDPKAASRVLTPNPTPKEPMDEPEQEEKPEAKPKGKGKPEKKAEKEQSIRDGLSDKAYDRLKGIMLNAFSPPGFLAMFRGMPYVNDPRMIDEILDLPRSEFEKLVTQAGEVGLKVPADRTDIRDIVKAASSQGQDGQAAKAITIEPAKDPDEKTPVTAAGGTASKTEPATGGTNKPSIAASLGAEEKPVPEAGKEAGSENPEEKTSASLDGASFAKKLRTIFKGADDSQINAVFKYLEARGITFKR